MSFFLQNGTAAEAQSHVAVEGEHGRLDFLNLCRMETPFIHLAFHVLTLLWSGVVMELLVLRLRALSLLSPVD